VKHRAKPNIYSFYKGNKYTLHPLKEDLGEASHCSKIGKIKGVFSAAKFEEDSKEMGVMYALVNKVV